MPFLQITSATIVKRYALLELYKITVLMYLMNKKKIIFLFYSSLKEFLKRMIGCIKLHQKDKVFIFIII